MSAYKDDFLRYALDRYTLNCEEVEYFALKDPTFLLFNTEKQELEQSLQGHDVNLIPLGFNGMVNAILIRWGLKKHPDQGGWVCPFDNQFTPFRLLLNTLRTDFRNYSADSVQHKAGKFEHCFIHSQHKITFTGDFAKQNLPDFVNVGRFNDVLAQRITNFRHALDSPRPIFLLHRRDDVENIREKIDQLNEILQARYPQARLLMINELGPNEVTASQGENVLNIPRPAADYSWRRDYFSQKGHDFEKKIVDFIAEHILTDPLPEDEQAYREAYLGYGRECVEVYGRVKGEERRDATFYKKAALWTSTFSLKKSMHCLDKALQTLGNREDLEVEELFTKILREAGDSKHIRDLFGLYHVSINDYLIRALLNSFTARNALQEENEKLYAKGVERSKKITKLIMEKTKILNQLSYRIGSKLVECTKKRNPLSYLVLPFVLMAEYRRYKQEKKG